MVEHLQSGDQTMARGASAWQAMAQVCEIGCEAPGARAVLQNLFGQHLWKRQLLNFSSQISASRQKAARKSQQGCN